ncbi:MmcQ/YjbR family DNA-binding protein [Frankia sp. R82]|uniref:MmcQ/YjbR family DNA-binding protein n=1 Tax=Frankia sp. R82 TaxID=2950553 RepID=UPI002043DDA3|nr:MmcQ/YjbR family DNA-binding protein [Frankia sp. R82]
MAGWADVRRIALGLPEVSEGTSYGNVAWRVRRATFAWERPLRRADLEVLRADPGGAAADAVVGTGEIPLAVRVADVGVRAALIAEDPDAYFTVAHFADFPAVLVRLGEIGVAELTELLTEAWLVRAPKRLAQRHLDQRHLDQRHPDKPC